MYALGQMIPFGGNFAPRDFATCSGQILDISQNTSLYAILGTTFGGDGRATYQLPDLRARAPAGEGVSPQTGVFEGLSLGQKQGYHSRVVTNYQMPAHSHTATFTPTAGGGQPPAGSNDPIDVTSRVTAVSNNADSNDPTGRVLAKSAVNIYASPSVNTVMSPAAITTAATGSQTGTLRGIVTVSNSGAGSQFEILDPLLGITHLISTKGYFPMRN